MFARILATLIASALLSSKAAATTLCAFPNPPMVLVEAGDPHGRGSRLLQVWEMDDAPVWWSDEEPAGYAAFRTRLAAKAGDTDPVRLLERNPSINNRIVAARAADWIRPINCLEMLLQQTQSRRVDPLKAPTEFMAVVLRSADTKRLRVYFYTINEDGIGRPTAASDPAAADSDAGWTVLAGVHNHGFHFGHPTLNAPLAPSTADARFNVSYAARAGMRQAWITNGIHTARIPAAAFQLFEKDGS